MNINKKKLIFKLAAILLPVLFLFFLEISAQLVYFFKHNKTFLYQTQVHHKTGFLRMDDLGLLWFKKNATVRLKHYSSYTADLYTDNFGLIHNGVKNRNLPEPSNFNIIFLGGSTVEGRGSSSNSNTIPALLEDCLRKRQENINVFNFGFSGDNSLNEVLRIYSRSDFFYPSLILALDGRNDFDSFYTKKNLLSNSHVSTSNLVNLYNNSDLIEIAGRLINEYLLENIVIYKYIYGKLKNKTSYTNHQIFEISFKNDKLIYLANHEAAAAWLKYRNKNINYAVFFQPTLAYKKILTKEEKIYIQNFDKKINSFGDYNANLKSFYDLFLIKPKDLKYDFYNLTDIFEKNEDNFYVDTVHYNDAGNLHIAKKMCDIVSKNYLKTYLN